MFATAYFLCEWRPQRQQQLDSFPLITSILELPSVQTSENVQFLFPGYFLRVYNSPNTRVLQQYSCQDQVKVISDWLLRPYVRGGTPPAEYIRSLTIGSTEREHRPMNSSQNNIEQLIEDLKEVSFSI